MTRSFDPVIPSAARDLGRMRSDRCLLCVYILASHSRVLYTGSTNDLHRRIYQHKAGPDPWLHARISRDPPRLVRMPRKRPVAGVTRERQIKSWRRAKKAYA